MNHLLAVVGLHGSVRGVKGGRAQPAAQVRHPDPGQHTYTAQPAGDAASVSAPVTVTIREPETAEGGRECPPDGTHGYQPDEDHYVVGSCDTLSGIAAWLGVTVEALLAANPQITDPDLIFPGQVINVP